MKITTVIFFILIFVSVYKVQGQVQQFENVAGLRHACIVVAGFNNDGDIDFSASGETNRKFFTVDKSSIFIYNNGDLAEHANNKTLMQYK